MAKKPPNHDYKVGYGKPPRHTQFKKGQSGNPKGRPRRSIDRSAKALLKAALLKEQIVVINGKRRRMCGLELIFAQLTRKASQGEMDAIKQIGSLLKVLKLDAEDEALLPMPTIITLKLGDDETIERVREANERERRAKLISRLEDED